jgi:hypothetical protein
VPDAAESQEKPASDEAGPSGAGAGEAAAAATDALVRFSCDPACDRVQCDGKKVSDPAEGVRLSPGAHRCVGSKAGYTPARDSFRVKAGEDLSRDLRLNKVRYTARPPAPAKTCGTFLNPCK